MLFLLSLHAPALAYDLLCGLTVTRDLTLTGDVDCTGYVGPALVLGADGITLNGGGYTLLAPDSSIGLYGVGRANLRVRDLTVDGSTVGVSLDGSGHVVTSLAVVNTDTAVAAYGTTFSVTESIFCGNASWALVDATSDGAIATDNYWGDPSGPTESGNPSGTGEAIFGGADYDPWNVGDDAVYAVAECAIPVNCYEDLDDDGQGSTVVVADVDGDCTDDPGQSEVDIDCDDTNAAVFVGAVEVCNGDVDDDCDGASDGADAAGATTWYADTDSDGYGAAGSTTEACAPPAGYVGDATDCDDTDAATSPGAAEVCDGVDDDCDGTVDDGVETTFYVDADGDTYGSPSTTWSGCSVPSGYAASSTDCDDADNLQHPGATEQCNAADDDCDGAVDDGVTYSSWYADTDGDGFGDPSSSPVYDCLAPSGTSDDPTDCDDGNGAASPNATEVCNGIDDDCDTVTDEGDAADAATWYEDRDGDTFGDPGRPLDACTQPSGYVADDLDCDDSEPGVNPTVAESCDDVDNNCDGSVDEDVVYTEWYDDADGDGYGAAGDRPVIACEAPRDTVDNDADCDDADASVFPTAEEVCDDLDNDCDGRLDEDLPVSTWYADADQDGFGDARETRLDCAAPDGFITDASDCDDADGDAYPGATEEWYDGVDQACDGGDDYDQDGDGERATEHGGDDCDDEDASTAEPCADTDTDTDVPDTDTDVVEEEPPPDEKEGGCNCDASGGAATAAWGLVLVAGALGRRRGSLRS